MAETEEIEIAIKEQEQEEEGEKSSSDISSDKPIDEPVNWPLVFFETRSAMHSLYKEKKQEYYEETNGSFREFYPYVYDIHYLEFTEKLYIYERDKKVGIFRLWIKRMEHLTNFEVIAEAKHKYMTDRPQISRLKTYSVIDLKYRTLYEQRTERQLFNGLKSKRKVVWEKIPNVYKIKSTCRNHIDGEYYKEENWFCPKDVRRVFTEAAFVFLLRRLAGTYFEGTIQFNLLFINGQLCPCFLYASKIKTFNWYKNAIQIKRFVKVVQCPNGKEQRSNIVMTTNGQIIYQDWSDTNLRLLLDKRAILCDDEKPPFNPDNLVPLRDRFYERRELYDFYTDEYYRNLEKYKNYFNDKPEARQLITFFLKELMLKKPHHVFDFAANYFCELL